MNRSRITYSIICALFLCVTAFTACIPPVRAQSSLSVSITPPLFQLEIGPGDSWSSSIKVVNNNNREVTYYAQRADFEAKDESGNPTIIPLVGNGSDSQTTFSLASWITVPDQPIPISPGGSAEIPFSIHVPQNAEPGGHYGAILIGTEPPATGNGNRIKISSFVSSLLFVRIKGDAIESGRILQFTSSKTLYQAPEAHFVLRFENTGTTHVKPVGNIIIYNMWGKERGRVDINQNTGNFGNVLPKSTRRFEFSWIGESNPFEIGEYRAVVTLAYGQDGKKNVSAITYFWVVPVVPVVITLTSIALLIALMTFFIRRYIRRALALERRRLGVVATALEQANTHITAHALLEPLREGVIDLRAAVGGTNAAPTQESMAKKTALPALQTRSTSGLLSKYKLFLLFLAVLIASGLMVSDYFDRVLVGQRQFQIKDVHIQEEATTTP